MTEPRIYHATIVGASMNPTLKSGDILVLTEVSPDNLKEGDIIGFQQGKTRVIHRVMAIEENGKSV